MKRSIVYIGNLLAFTAVAYFLYISFLERQIFQQIQFSLSSGSIILLSALALIIVALLGAIIWYALLRSMNEEVTISSIVKIFFLSQAAKYIPGNVAHHIGRVVLAKRLGIGLVNTVFAMFIETLLVVGVAAFLALATLLTAGKNLLVPIPYIPQFWVLTILVIVALITPLLSHRALEWTSRLWSRRRGIEFQSVNLPSLRTFWLSILLYIFTYLVMGLILQLIASGVFGKDQADIFLLSGIFAVAWVLGFITPGAPAGIGVREVVLVTGLAPVYGNETAIGIAAVLRFVTVLGDGLVFLTGIILSKTSLSMKTPE